jgi:tetratricopeptide (TPR) repeat protein
LSYVNPAVPEHPDTAACIHDLAQLVQDQGDFTAARPLYERALAIYEKVLGPEHQDMATAMSNFARLLEDTVQVNEAERLFRKAITVGEKALGPDHSDTQRYASHYARLLVRTERADEALARAESASPHTTRFLVQITRGPRTTPASLPTSSTHLAAQRR